MPKIVCYCLECKRGIEWLRYAYLTAINLEEIVGVPKMGRTLRKMVQWFPRLELLDHA